MSADTCGALKDWMTCDRAPGHDGDHRGYDEQHDAVLFWPTSTRLLEELERAIPIALAAVEPKQRRAAAARLKRTIDDAHGGG